MASHWRRSLKSRPLATRRGDGAVRRGLVASRDSETNGKTMIADTAHPVRASCPCGTCSFETKVKPKARLICHCTICQAFTGNPFSDVVVIPGLQGSLSNEDYILFRNYKKFGLPPPNLKRGRCRVCLKPVVETFGFFPFKIFFVPTANFENPGLLPPPQVHVFYEHRQCDARDDAPKYEGYVDSQAAIVKAIGRAL